MRMPGRYFVSVALAGFAVSVAYAQSPKPAEPRITFAPELVERVHRSQEVPQLKGGSIVVKPAAGEVCVDYHLADGVGWPENRWVDDCCWVDTPFGSVCVWCPKCEIRDCTKRFYAQVCMPDPGQAGQEALDACVKIAAAAAVPTLVCCGPGAAAGVFTEALKDCLIAHGQTWASQLHVQIREEADCGAWRNCT